MSEQVKSQFPTEIIDLPSKGKLYPKEHPFSSGKVEMRYMTAKEEDILTSQTLLRKGIAFDKVLESLIVEKIDLNSLLLGDKNALMIAARVLGYGKDYKVSVQDPNDVGNKEEVNVDLSKLDDKKVDFSRFIDGTREFSVKLPLSKREVTVKVLTSGDDKIIDGELKGLKKLEKTTGVLPEMTTRLKYAITAIDGNDKKEAIRSYVDNELLAGDSSFLRDEIYDMTPDVDMSFAYESSNGEIEEMDLPIDISFFFLTAEDRPYIHNEIWNLLYHGNGGWDYTSVYNMPIWLRQYYLKKIIDYNEDQGAKRAEKQATQAHQQSQNKDSILRPAIKPPQN